MGTNVHPPSHTDVLTELRYEEWPGQDYPRIITINTQGGPGLFRLRECLERLASRKVDEFDLLSEVPARSDAAGRCVWHVVASPVERSVTLSKLPDGKLSVDWYAGVSFWQGQLKRFTEYIRIDFGDVDGLVPQSKPPAPRGTGPAACFYPDFATTYDLVFEVDPWMQGASAT